MSSRRELERFFDDADLDQSGYLNQSELRSVLKKFGYNLTDAQVEKLFKSIDTSGDKRISRREFIVAMDLQVEKEDHEVASIRRTFRSFDREGNGLIDRSELSEAFRLMGEHLSEDDLSELISTFDRDSSGQLDYEEFIQLFQQRRPVQ